MGRPPRSDCGVGRQGPWLPILLWLVVGSTAGAQAGEEPATTDGHAEKAADAAFAAGVSAVEAGDWAGARARFEESFRLWPHPRTLLNVAGARAQTGALLEAIAAYREYLLRSADTPENHGVRVQAGNLIEELEARLPRLRVRVEGARESDAVRVDGEAVQHRNAVPVNPGKHRVEVLRGAQVIASQEVHAERPGETLVHLSVVLASDNRSENRGNEGGGLWVSPWFWTAVGAVVVGGAATAIVLATGGGTPSADTGNLPGVSSVTVSP
ncbi:MAG: tetratricopeptide repeat protein [Myxococcales bacterium]|nr:tetratricopeptide repeat protein [Myxococcales bacterium]